MEFKHWFEDAEAAIRAANAEKLIVVGSSMGGWISLKIANSHPGLVQGLLLIAPAVNFLKPKYDMWYASCPPQVQRDQDEGKATIMNSGYHTIPVRKEFVSKSVELELDLKSPLEITCPVRIIHGVQDDTIPYAKSLDVMNMISTENVELIYQKSGDHIMANESSIELILRTLDDMITRI